MKLQNLIAITLLLGQTALTAVADRPVRERTFRLTYSAVVNGIPSGAGRAELWVPYPQSDRNQTIHQVRIAASSPAAIGRPPGSPNQMLHIASTRGGIPLQIRLEILATRRENPGEKTMLKPAEAAPYLAPEPLVPVDGPVRALAAEAVAGKKTDAEKARAIYEKVTAMMKYDKSGTGWGRGDALFACDARRGNCTDFHSLIIGMARSQGIPARFAMGLPLPEKRGAGAIPGYHCWAEIYVQGRGWVPVDSSEAAKAVARGDRRKKDYFYGHHDENRLEFSRGRQVILYPRQKGGPLNFFIYPYAEVDGEKHDTVEWKFEYADVEPPEAG